MFEIIGIGEEFARPGDTTVVADTHSTVPTMTSPSKHSKIAFAAKAVGRRVFGNHLGRSIGNGGFFGFSFRSKRKGLEELVGEGWVLGYPTLIRVDSRNPQITGSIVVDRGRKKNPWPDLVSETTGNGIHHWPFH